MIKNFLKDESGQGMVEYILIVALIAIAVIAALKLFGKNLTSMFNTAGEKIGNEAAAMK